MRSQLQQFEDIIHKAEADRLELTARFNFLQQILCVVVQTHGGEEKRVVLSKQKIESISAQTAVINLRNDADSDDVIITFFEKSVEEKKTEDEAALKTKIAAMPDTGTRLVCREHRDITLDVNGNCKACVRERVEIGECTCGHYKRSHLVGSERCKIGNCECNAFECKHIHRAVELDSGVAVCSCCGDRLEQSAPVVQ